MNVPKRSREVLCSDPLVLVLHQDLRCFEKQWSSFFSSLDLETHLSILDLSEAQAGEVCDSNMAAGFGKQKHELSVVGGGGGWMQVF